MSRTVEIPYGYDNLALEACAEALSGPGFYSLADNLLKARVLEEPMGLGAVAEDKMGVQWVRLPGRPFPWYAPGLVNKRWDEIQAPAILSEGVQ